MTGPSALGTRVAALEALYRRIAAQRMQGVAVLHAGLAVQALGFAVEVPVPVGGAGSVAARPGGIAAGVLITPWFMNLLRLPLRPMLAGEPQAAARPDAGPAPVWLDIGHKAQRPLGTTPFEFIGAFEPGFGAFEACSLFSPMWAFADQAAAVATAHEVLGLLRPVPGPALAPAPVDAEADAVASRRGFLFGRRAGARAP